MGELFGKLTACLHEVAVVDELRSALFIAMEVMDFQFGHFDDGSFDGDDDGGDALDAVDAVEVAFGLADEDAAEDSAGFGDQVGGEDGVGFAGEAGSEVVEVGVDQLGVVDEADRPVGAVGLFEFDEGAEAVVA